MKSPEELRAYNREYARKWRAAHRERMKEITQERREYNSKYMREWRRRNPERAREISRTANEKYRTLMTENYRASAVKYAHRTRERALVFLGGKCVRCGFADPRALQVDHINGRGAEDRRNFRQQYYIRKFIVEHPDEAKERYQVLCANCNMIKRWENREWGGGRPVVLRSSPVAGAV